MIPTVIALMIVSDREWMWLIFLLNKNSWMWVIVAHFFWEVIVSDLTHEKCELAHLCPSFAERPNGHFQSLTLSSPQEFRHVRAPQKDNCYLKFWPQGALRSPVLKLLMSFESFWPEIFDKMWVFNQTTDYYSWQFQVVHVYIPFKKEGRWTNMDILSTYYVLLKSFE